MPASRIKRFDAAHTATVLIAAGDGSFHRFIEIGIVEHDKGSDPPAQARISSAPRPHGRQSPPGADAAGDGYRRDAVVIDNLRNAVIGGVHPTKYTIRQAGGGKISPSRRALPITFGACFSR